MAYGYRRSFNRGRRMGARFGPNRVVRREFGEFHATGQNVSVALPQVSANITNQVVNDFSLTPKGIIVNRVWGTIEAQPTIAPAANTSGMLCFGLIHHDPIPTSTDIDILTSTGMQQLWHWREMLAYEFTAAPVAGAYVPTGRLHVSARGFKLRTNTDGLYLTAQVIPASSVQIWTFNVRLFYSVTIP